MERCPVCDLLAHFALLIHTIAHLGLCSQGDFRLKGVELMTGYFFEELTE